LTDDNLVAKLVEIFLEVPSMKKLMMLAAALMLTGFAPSAFAADNMIRPMLGFNASAVNFGVDYEKHVNHDMSWGGYFFYGSEHKDNVASNQMVAFGANLPISLLDNGQLDIYLAPGFGFAMVKGLNGADDATTLGPSAKLGAEWKFSPTLRGGVQYMEIYNWFTDKAASSAKYASATLGISF
jgi:hypothetical protein